MEVSALKRKKAEGGLEEPGARQVGGEHQTAWVGPVRGDHREV